MMFADKLSSWPGARDVLVRGIKLTVVMGALGFVLAFVAYGHRHTPGLESTLWQSGSLTVFVSLSGVFHGRYRVGENLVLAYVWAGLLAFWVFAIAAFLAEAHWPGALT